MSIKLLKREKRGREGERQGGERKETMALEPGEVPSTWSRGPNLARSKKQHQKTISPVSLWANSRFRLLSTCVYFYFHWILLRIRALLLQGTALRKDGLLSFSNPSPTSRTTVSVLVHRCIIADVSWSGYMPHDRQTSMFMLYTSGVQAHPVGGRQIRGWTLWSCSWRLIWVSSGPGCWDNFTFFWVFLVPIAPQEAESHRQVSKLLTEKECPQVPRSPVMATPSYAPCIHRLQNSWWRKLLYSQFLANREIFVDRMNKVMTESVLFHSYLVLQ